MTFTHPRVVIAVVVLMAAVLALIIAGQLTGYGMGFEHAGGSYGFWAGSNNRYCFADAGRAIGCESAQ